MHTDFLRGIILALFALFADVIPVFASGGEESAGHGGEAALIFLFLAILLLAGKMGGLVEKFGQPSVLGELVVGMILGNIALFGFPFFDQIAENGVISILAELGVVILLFQIGLESNIRELGRVGVPALLVGIVGVAVPFVLGTYVIGPLLFPEVSANSLLFLGAALVATSVGITARVFRDLGKLQTREARTILGAAVIDDILGLIILAVVVAIAQEGSVSGGEIGTIFATAVAFLVGAIAAGQLLADRLSRLFARINDNIGMKLAFPLSIGLIFAYIAGEIGLAPIVGAFAAGLILDPVHLRRFRKPAVVQEMHSIVHTMNATAKQEVDKIVQRYDTRHIEDLIEPISLFLVPIFFVYTGMLVDLSTFADPTVVLSALAVTVLAIVGKAVAGLFAKGADKWLVGFGMVPRGEVGLIFATTGQQLGVISSEVFSVIIIMVILTTLMAPPVLNTLLQKRGEEDEDDNESEQIEVEEATA